MKPSNKDTVYAMSVDMATLAKLFGISETRVVHLVDNGIIVQKPDKMFEMGSSVSSYVRWLKQQHKLAPEGSARATAEQEKALQIRAQRRLTELKLDQAKGELYKASEVDAHISHMIAVVRSKMLGIPSKIAPVVADEIDYHKIEGVIKREITDALSELAAYTPPSLGREDDDNSDGTIVDEENT